MLRLIGAAAVVLAFIAVWPQVHGRAAGDVADQVRWRLQERAERLEARARRLEARAARVAAPAEADGDWVDMTRPRHTGAHVSVARDYTLPREAAAAGRIVVIGGTATIEGHAEGDVVVIGGLLRVGPAAIIDGDVAVLGGRSVIDPAATIRGEVKNVGADWRSIIGRGRYAWGDGWWRALALGSTMLRLLVTFVFVCLLTLVFPRSIGDVTTRIDAAPGVSIVTGLVAQILFVPALVVLVLALLVSIVGIPLLAGLPVLLALFAGLWVAGFAAASARVGASIRGVDVVTSPRLGDVLVGFLALTACTILGQVLLLGAGWLTPLGGLVRVTGGCIEYLAWTLGLGAALTTLFGRRRRDLPPPIPTAAAAPTTP